MLRLTLWPLLALWLVAAPPPDDDIDTFWAEAKRTVEEGDFDGYAALYHDDAVLVNAISGVSYPIADALAGWRQGFVDTAEGRAETSLDFRFTQRLHGETTAHDSGYFRYETHAVGEPPAPTIVKFESLVVRGPDGWQWLMEYQIAVATQAEWDAAGS